MLGWEFPPHITGGLGTACRGLTRGLAAAGVEVVFVVPRAHGDEAADWMHLLDVNGKAAEVHALPAELRPYRAAGPGLPSAATRAALARLPGWERPDLPRHSAGWLELAEGVAAAVREADSTDASVANAPVEAGAFRGGYGPDLFGEVARYAAGVAGLARAMEVDVVHAHDWMTFPAGVAAARVLGVPLVAHVHATEYDRAASGPDQRVLDVERMGLTAADRVVTVSRFAAEKIAARFRVPLESIRVVHNSVERSVTERPPRVTVSDPPTVLFLGRVTHQKGPDHLLEAARRVIAERPEVRFVIAGDGDMLAHTVRRGASEGLAENVFYTGFLDREQVARAFAVSDLYVMPSVSEPFGIAPLEAVEAGVPVLVSNQSGVAEVLESGMRFDFWNSEDLARKILDALGSEDLRRELIEGARRDLERSSWSESGRATAQVYAELAP
jgi:glycogen(starch) synthase